MRFGRIRLSACTVAALLTGTVACTTDGAGAADVARHTVDTACRGGSYTWFDIDRRDVLTGVGQKQRIGKGGGPLTNRLSPLRTPATAVTFEKGPRADPDATLSSLGDHIGETNATDGDGYGFADVRRPAPELVSNTTTVSDAGTYVEYAWVRQITGDFQYTCGGKRAAGRAIGWTTDGSGILECSTPIDIAVAGEPAPEAARLSCGAQSPAAKVRRPESLVSYRT
ncbi:hypothetical protein ACH4M4_22340 [Streptomyces sp. NPDC017254]|uniref:hypothetical protein n=1 Tax=unclassified Streptomyces TaxID=2593676 RepID=UPI0037B982D3